MKIIFARIHPHEPPLMPLPKDSRHEQCSVECQVEVFDALGQRRLWSCFSFLDVLSGSQPQKCELGAPRSKSSTLTCRPRPWHIKLLRWTLCPNHQNHMQVQVCAREMACESQLPERFCSARNRNCSFLSTRKTYPRRSMYGLFTRKMATFKGNCK